MNRSEANNKLLEAIISGNNKEIMKANRMICVLDLIESDDPTDRARYTQTIFRITQELIKIDSRSDVSEEDKESFDLLDEIRSGING